MKKIESSTAILNNEICREKIHDIKNISKCSILDLFTLFI